MSSPPELDRRARKILQAVVSEYLHSGDPVGSRTVTRRHGIQLSPATVRNVMADLEELGLLAQRHTSAGRVPTETGLRFFIDALLQVRGLSAREKDDIRARLGGNPQSVVHNASKVLAELTQYAGVVLAPDPGLARMQHIEFVPLRGNRFLCILVTTDGRIENRLIDVDFEVDRERLDRIHNYLDGLIAGLTLEETRTAVVRAVGDQKNAFDTEVASALKLGQRALAEFPRSAEVVVAGGANLVDPERVSGPGQARELKDLLRALEDKEVLSRLLDRAQTGAGIQVYLGAETDLAPLETSSVVAMPYGTSSGGRPLGAIAVVGPMRMNYGKIMSVVDFTADLVSQILEES